MAIQPNPQASRNVTIRRCRQLLPADYAPGAGGRRWSSAMLRTSRSALPQPSPANRAQARRTAVGVRAPVCGLGMASDGLANRLAVGQYLGRADQGVAG